jgi:hypothetical protein
MKIKYSPPGPLPDVSAQRLDSLRAAYDPDYGLVKLPAYSMGYFTNYKGGELVHPIRESMEFAWLLLLTDPASDLPAIIIEKVLQHQELDSSKEYFGVWPWFAEESLQEMDGVDYNWADFIGAYLVDLLAFRLDSLCEKAQRSMKEALHAACASICRRNVPPNYTNICAMDAAVTCSAGEILQNKEYFDYGFNSLRELYFRLSGHVVFDEYNSPAYTTILIEELDRLLRLVNNVPSRKMAISVRNWAWTGIGLFYNNELKEWGGPHSRTYFDFCGKRQNRFLSEKAGVFGKILSNQPCPLKVRKLFTGENRFPLMIREKTPNGEWLSLWKDVGCQLGSISEGQTWVQGRPVIAHYRDGTQSIGSFRVRVLYNGRDYAGSSVSCTQVEDVLLLGLRIGPGNGIWHPYMDKPLDGIIRPEDLRIRFEVRSVDVAQSIKVDNEGFRGLLLTPEYSIQISSTGSWLGKELLWEKGFSGTKNKNVSESDVDNWFPTICDLGGTSSNSKWIDGVLRLDENEEFKIIDWNNFSFAAAIKIAKRNQTKAKFLDKIPSISNNGQRIEYEVYKSSSHLQLKLEMGDNCSKNIYCSAIKNILRRIAKKLWVKFLTVRYAWANAKLIIKYVKKLFAAIY